MSKFDDMIDGLQQEVEVPEQVWKKYTDTLSELTEKERVSSVKNKWLKVAISTAAMVVIGTVICCTNPVLAEKIPVLGRIFQEVQQEVRFSGDYSDNVEILDIEEKSTMAEDVGVTFTASEIYSDGMSIYLAAEVVVAQGGLNNIPSNGMYLQGNWKLAGDEEAISMVNNNLYGRVVDDYTFVGMVKLNLKKNDIQDGTLELNLSMIGYDDINMMSADDISASHKIEGKWNLVLPFSVDEEAARTIPVYKEANGFCIEKVQISPYQIITYTSQESGWNNNIFTVVFNQNGEKLEFVEESQGRAIIAVQEAEITKLYIYVLDNFDAWIDVNKKGMDCDAARNANVSAEVIVE